MINAIVFDLDDTLVDRNATMLWALSEQYNHYKDSLAGISKSKYVNEVLSFQDNGYTNPQSAYELFFKNEKNKPITINELYNDLISRYGMKTILFDGVVEALEKLRTEYILSIITNGRIDWQYRKIRQSGIGSYFENVIISEEVGFEKPDKEIFRLCLKKIGINPENSIYVGDNPEIDIKPAIEVGMRTIWKDNGYFKNPKEANGVIKKFNNIMCEIEKIKREEI